MKVCLRCGKELSEFDAFCKDCGTPFVNNTLEQEQPSDVQTLVDIVTPPIVESPNAISKEPKGKGTSGILVIVLCVIGVVAGLFIGKTYLAKCEKCKECEKCEKCEVVECEESEGSSLPATDGSKIVLDGYTFNIPSEYTTETALGDDGRTMLYVYDSTISWYAILSVQEFDYNHVQTCWPTVVSELEADGTTVSFSGPKQLNGRDYIIYDLIYNDVYSTLAYTKIGTNALAIEAGTFTGVYDYSPFEKIENMIATATKTPSSKNNDFVSKRVISNFDF